MEDLLTQNPLFVRWLLILLAVVAVASLGMLFRNMSGGSKGSIPINEWEEEVKDQAEKTCKPKRKLYKVRRGKKTQTMRIYNYIKKFGPVSIGEIRNGTRGIKKSNINTLVQNLYQDGEIERVARGVYKVK